MKKIFTLIAVAFACTALNAQTLKFAHVDFNEITQLMPEMDDARAQLDAANKEAQEAYNSMIEEFQTKYQQYEQKQSTWTPAVKESKEKELTEIQTRIQEFNNAISQELQQKQQELIAPIYQKAQETINKLAKEQGIAYVFEKSAALYIDDTQSVDLTPAARKALNIPEGRTLETLQAELQAAAEAQQAAAQPAN